MRTDVDIFGLFGFNLVEAVQDFFGSIVAWILGFLEDLVGINLVDED